MKNCKVKAIIRFDDVVEKVHRKIGDEFYCDENRYKFLSNHNAVELIEKITVEQTVEAVEDAVEAVKPKKTTKRKKKNE